ncbi:MAG: thioredoxin [Ferrimicrobium sp.]|jgi:putative thioredoxin|nr:thioredoxin [Ferrimicrobium sp.]
MDVTDATFEQDVIEASKDRPIVVDLWAPWCGPCRTLSPIIEKVVAETEGKVELVKINVDENPASAQAFKVQGIPAVFAIKDGKIVDSFVGAYPESQVREFVAKLAPAKTVVDVLIEEGNEPALRQALELEPANDVAGVSLAKLLADRGELDEAEAILARFPETAEIAKLKAKIRLAREGSATLSEDEITKELDELLDSVKSDDVARQRFLDLLNLLPENDPRINEYRRTFTSRLF